LHDAAQPGGAAAVSHGTAGVEERGRKRGLMYSRNTVGATCALTSQHPPIRHGRAQASWTSLASRAALRDGIGV
ncbi:MAG: hypothetical protein ACN6OP_04010, partial [Pseudomonadales bacterium]